MSKTKFTPGPWVRVDTADYAEIHHKDHKSDGPLALVARPEDADAIAALPDLVWVSIVVEAFTSSVLQNGALPSDENARQLRQLANAALAKVRGETHPSGGDRHGE